LIGKTISHYKILEKLGEGGMGDVYKAEDTNLDRVVALKFLPMETTRDKDMKTRFIHEAKAASSLQHHNIYTIHEIDETDDGQLFIVMDCYDGKTVEEKIKQSPLEIDEAIDITIQIAQGLDKAHKKKIIHRDIKSANIIVTTDGIVKIVDFGIAKLAGQTKVTKDGTSLGTATYMSPEQTLGKEVDHRTDIWSVGVVLYEMLTGLQPFQGDYEQAVVYSIMNEEPKPLTGLRTGISIQFEQIVNKALAKDPNERYQHLDELIVDLKHVKKEPEIEKTEVQAPPPPTPAVTKPVWKQPITMAISTFILIVIVGVLLYSIINKTESEVVPDVPQINPKSVAVLPFTSIDRTEEGEIFSDGMHDDILTQVAKIGDLKVVSRTSVMRYRDTDKSMKEIAQELSVGTILEGSVRRAGMKVRIVAQLINAESDEHLWAETYDRDYADIFAIQTDVAENIASALKATLTPQEISSIESVPTENMEAYDYYLKGKYYWDTKTDREGNLLAAELLEKAVELDPSFTLAYAWLAIVDFVLYSAIDWDPTPERLGKGKTALEMAADQDPDLPEVHYARAWYYAMIEMDYKKVIIEALKALEGRPNDGEINKDTGMTYMFLGEWDKAEVYLLKGYKLNPHGLQMALFVASFYTRMRDWSKAEYYIDKAIVSFPENPNPYWYKAVIAIMGYGDTEKAYRIIEEGAQGTGKHTDMLLYRFRVGLWSRRFQDILDAVEPFPDFDYYYYSKGFAYWFMGQKEQAKTYLDSARIVYERQAQTAPHNIDIYSILGLVYAGLGMKEQAIQTGIKAVELEPIYKNAYWAPERHKYLSYIYSMVGEYDKALDEIELILSIPYYFTTWDLKLSPYWDPMRDHPRFQELIVKYSD
jgi:serine/threonine protein kinase/tetratricopeptide (TPR) repeat protein